MRTSCISHPSENRFSLLRQDYWDICETDELCQTARACAAKLLNVFEQWMNNKIQNTVQIKRHNKAAENEGLEPHTDDETDLWVYESADDLHQALISEHPIKTVRQALSWLVSQNLLLRRNNPNFRWDKTYQYMLNVSTLQDRIDALNSPKSTHRSSPQGTSSDLQGTSIVPTGESNTIDSFLDSNTDSNLDQYPPNPQKQINQEGGGEAIKVEVEILKEESIQKPASIPSDQKPSPLTALTIGEDQKRSAAAPIAPQQEIRVFPTAVTRQSDYISGVQRMEDRFNRKLQPWQQFTEHGQPEVNEDFVTYVAKLMPKSDMNARTKARNHIINATRSESESMKVRGYWKDFQALLSGEASFDLYPLNEADQKFKEQSDRVAEAIRMVHARRSQQQQEAS